MIDEKAKGKKLAINNDYTTHTFLYKVSELNAEENKNKDKKFEDLAIEAYLR